MLTRLSFVFALLLAFPGVAMAACAAAGAGLEKCTFVGGPHDARWYRVHVPASGSGARPLVVVLHGAGTTEDNGAADMRTASNMETYGDTLNGGNGMIIAYPWGGVVGWNAAPEACAKFGSCLDDVAFINAVFVDIKARWSVDNSRVTLVGHSMGALTTYRFACQAGDNPHATQLWIVSGGLSNGEVSICNSSTRTPLYIVNGMTDEFFGYTGGNPSGLFWVSQPVGQAAYQTISRVARGGTTNDSTLWQGTKLGAGVDADGECTTTSFNSETKILVWTFGAGFTTPYLVASDSCHSIAGMGHRWPGYAGNYGTGIQVAVYTISNTILEFTITPPF